MSKKIILDAKGSLNNVTDKWLISDIINAHLINLSGNFAYISNSVFDPKSLDTYKKFSLSKLRSEYATVSINGLAYNISSCVEPMIDY